jgi:hypothetical protein
LAFCFVTPEGNICFIISFHTNCGFSARALSRSVIPL